MEKEFLTLTETGKLLGISKYHLRKWPSWARYGLIPSRWPGGRGLKFYKPDILRMMDKLKVQRGALNESPRQTVLSNAG